MKPPKIPDNEAERLHALRALGILDTAHEERFDRVTRMAKRMFGVPMSLVSLIDEDRQWFKSVQGIDVEETERKTSFCAHAINSDGLFIIPNAVCDERFCDHPMVVNTPNIRFYAGCPLKLRQGLNIGTLCLIDSKPRDLDSEDRQLLQDLGAMIEQEIKSVQMATLDELTMISNRRGFLSLAEQVLQVCKRKQHNSSIIVFDLNKFKPINDTYGHHEGDHVLKVFAMELIGWFRESDVVGRWGGDEFVVLLSDTTPEMVKSSLSGFSDNMAKVNQESGKPYNIEFSCGVSCHKYDCELSIEERIERADKEMYKVKRSR
ncbi:GGDEF domain-containing protein [Vibrio zhanjiangensis]|uniref:GGDEF domain-containing protein n=1 Tax=Vibrio zhanjiangensis TaxID=1046128 RepID=A0ABQ6EV35_9VIBR|nr:sensor domain-containing diguanylate cyclase [Vibrio zhanjiangensis]GLT17047.1 GGDEF domain-containing protein [Vibrio zhanjiangensis]